MKVLFLIINYFIGQKFHNQYKHLIHQCKKLSAQGNFQHLPITATGLATALRRTKSTWYIFMMNYCRYMTSRLWAP